jgi:hypothetical protein
MSRTGVYHSGKLYGTCVVYYKCSYSDACANHKYF